MLPYAEESAHVVQKDENVGKVVTTTGGVLLGKMSFQMLDDEFDISGFELVKDTNSPLNGIKINLNIIEAFEEQSTFRFTDQTASKETSLSDIVISSGEKDDEVPSNSTYKEYSLNPIFNKETLYYEIELLEYIDTMKIKAITTDDNAKMKLEVPKRDENNNLIYDTDGVTIIYEEKDFESDIPLEFILNKLGEPDTKLTIKITAEDNKTTSSYEVIIKRPYATIKGQIYTEPTKNTTQKSKANIKVYSSDKTKEIINWEEAKNNPLSAIGDEVNKKLNEITPIGGIYETNDDGTYEVIIIPGKYDILVDKAGYLDQIYINIEIEKETTKDLGYQELIPGDVNKDGLVEILDKVILTKLNGKSSIDEAFNQACDFNDDEIIEILDKTVLTKNNGQKRNVVDYEGGS